MNEITVPLVYCELDSHADTCCLGTGCYVLYQTDTADVSGFVESLGKIKEAAVITGVLAYDEEESGNTYLLYFHQALHLPQMKNRCLLNPNQMREAGVEVNDVPLKYLKPEERTHRAHSLLARNDEEDEVRIPLDLVGVLSQFKTRKPTSQEIESIDPALRINMTNDRPEWQPNDSTPDVDERTLRQSISNETPTVERDRRINVRMTRAMRINNRKITVSDITHRRKGTVNANEIAKRWNIGLPSAERTFATTTQLGVRDFTGDSEGGRRLKHTAYQLRHRRLRADVYTDTLFSETKSLDQNTCGQIFATDFGWVHFVPMRSKGDAPETLAPIFDEYGIFNHIIPDNAPELTSHAFRKIVHKYGSRIKPVEAWTPNQNLAEANIRELKRLHRREMQRSNAPAVLWGHCLMLAAERRSHTAFAQTSYGPLIQQLTGDTPDISHIVEHQWYDWVWYANPGIEGRQLGRWLGPSRSVGQAMCGKVLTAKGKIIHRTSIWPIKKETRLDDGFKEASAAYTTQLTAALGNRMAGIPLAEDEHDEYGDETPTFEAYEDDEQSDVRVPEADDYAPDAYDKLISAKVILPVGDNNQKGTVRKRKRDEDGKMIGRASNNPYMDTTLYEVEFDDGLVQTYAANIIAENIFEQLDDEGNVYKLIDEITGHKSDNSAIPISDGEFQLNGRTHKKRTTKGWWLCVQWKDGSTSWEAVKDMKESYPIKVAEYAVANRIDKEPAFVWWVPFTLRRRARLIKAATSTRYMRKWQKYGIKIPKTVERALEIDRETGTDYWRKALQLEISKIFPAVKILDEGVGAPVGYQTIPCHIVFDVKMDFTRKARYVAGGHKTDDPETPTYASVVSRESVRIGFLLAALNGLEVLTADIAGAYLNAPCHEKVCTVCGLEFGAENKGRIAIIQKALYGLKTSAYAWREHLSTTLHTALGYRSCRADPDVYIRPSQKPNGEKYYEMIFVYTDDILIVSHKAMETLTMLDQHYLLKPDSIGIPTIYLGNQVQSFDINGDATQRCWALSSDKYVKAAIKNVTAWLEEREQKLKTRAPSVLPCGYRPELDTSPYCDPEMHNFYQQQIGVLRWIVELGRIDVTAEVSMLAAFLAGPREGHVEAMLHLFAYLNLHDRSRLVLDPSYIEHGEEPTSDWSGFYPEAVEDIPPDMPEPLGKAVQITAFVDSDHAGDLLTRRSRTGILIYVNQSPIAWYSKKQTSVETSTFGSEFMALKVGVEMLKRLRYKLRMMGVPLDGHAHVRVNNVSVVYNSSLPESTLRKKSNSVAYHYVWENVANGTCKVAYEPSKTNLADLLTKIQTGPERTRLAKMILF